MIGPLRIVEVRRAAALLSIAAYVAMEKIGTE